MQRIERHERKQDLQPLQKVTQVFKVGRDVEVLVLRQMQHVVVDCVYVQQLEQKLRVSELN